MSRRIVCFLSVSFLFGCAVAEYGAVPFLFLWAAVEAAWLYSIRKASGRKAEKKAALLALSLGCFGLGLLVSLRQQSFRTSYEPYVEDGAECLAQGDIFRKEQKSDRKLFYLKNCTVQFNHKNHSCDQILVYLEAGNYSIGETICVKGKIKTFSLPRNEGNYNERQYYRSLKFAFSLDSAEVLEVHGNRNICRELLAKWRMSLADSYERCMEETDAGVMCAMTLGDKSRMEQELKNLYQRAGINHFYCISGLHISMLGMAFYWLFRKRGGSYAAAGMFAGAAVVFYGLFTGFGVSAVRAIGMFLISIYAKCRGRSYDSLTALSLMAAVLAGENPGLLHHAGFLLSFGAVFGVIMAQEFLEDVRIENMDSKGERQSEKWKERANALLVSGKEMLYVSACIQFMTIPVLCSFFYEISVYAIVINIFVLPCVGLLLGLGLAGGLAGCISVKLGSLLLFPCHWILEFFGLLCGFFLRLPCAVRITGVFGAKRLFFWYGGLILAWYLYRKYGRKRLALVFVPVLCVFLLAVQPKQGAEMDILDVGQGDGIYLSAGDGTACFIDGGSSSESKVGTYRILPFLKYRGVTKIDYWFVSHCDNDHISGLTEVLEADYAVKNLVVSYEMPEDEAWKSLRELAEKKGVGILRMKRGDSLAGRDKEGRKTWSFRCLFPGSEYRSEDRNSMSLALRFESESFSGFFAGDLPKEQEQFLVDGRLSKTDVFKASHHGSNTSNSRELLEALQPEFTVISCGKNNRYGHPGKEALARMEAVDTKICQTMYSGQIRFRPERGRRLEMQKGFVIE